MNRNQASQVTTGMIVLAIGLLLLAGELDVGRWDFSRLWPVIFLVIAVGRFLGPSERRRSGVWFLFFGGVFLLHTFGVVTLRQSWPLFIVAAGISMMFERGRCAGDARPAAGEPVASNHLHDGRFRP